MIALTNQQARLEAKEFAAWTPSKVGDLILVRDFQKDKHYGRKLDPI